VTVEKGEGPASAFRLAEVAGVAVVPRVTDHEKCQRCWRYTYDVGSHKNHKDACARCAEAVEMMEKAG
jgi:isoleucyl-tRNA synthetase